MPDLINPDTVKYIPNPQEEGSFDPSVLPVAEEVLFEMQQPLGEIQLAMQDGLVGFTDNDVIPLARKTIGTINHEIYLNEQFARKPISSETLREIAGKIGFVVLISRPGTYSALNKPSDPAYNSNPALQGADRLNSDSGAAIGIVLAGIKTGILTEEEIKIFLKTRMLKHNDPLLEPLKEKARRALIRSDMRFVYTGKKPETEAIQRILSRDSSFVPRDSVDFLDHNRITNTLTQVQELKSYFEDKKITETGRGVLFVTDTVQMPRFSRMANKAEMLPQVSRAYIHPRAISKNGFTPYAKGEIKGTFRAILTGKASAEPMTSTFI